jgi:hypothetical protein
LRVRRPGFLLLGVLLALSWVFCATLWPLQSLYGLLTSGDRVGNLGLVQVVAAGNSPLRSPQAGQLTFEPFWGLLVGLLSGFDPERVLWLYPFLSLATSLGFASALYACLRGPAWSEWERVAVAAFATLLSSAPFEYAGTYRVPWAMTFLLKPNHALGFVLMPLLWLAFARIRGWRGRVATGLLLHVLGWVFVIHMVFAAAGLLALVCGSWLARHPERGKDAKDAAAVIGINVLVVSPYLVILLVSYPFLYASARAMIPPGSAHLLEATLKHGPLFLLGVWGALLAARRDRLGRVFAAQLAAGYAIWAAVLLLSVLQIARERDEIYYFVRFLTAAAAGIGAWDLAGRAATWLGRGLPAPHARCAALLALALPWSLPYWWNPLVMDSYVAGSLQRVPDRLRLPTDFIRRSTPRTAIFAGDRDYARYVAALGARRVSLTDNLHTPPGYAARAALERALVQDASGRQALPLAREQGVTHLLVTPRLLLAHPEPSPRGLADFDRREHLERAFLWRGEGRDFVAIYAIREAAR